MNKLQFSLLALIITFCQLHATAQILDWTINHVEGNATTGSVNNYATVEGSTKDSNGNIVAVGRFLGEIDMDPGVGVDLHISRYPLDLTNNYYQSGFIKKLDSQGNYLWTKTILSTGLVSISDVAADQNGNYYVTGSFNGQVYKDSSIVGNTGMYQQNIWGVSNTTSSSQYVVFILKISSEGEIMWFKKFGDAPALQFGGNARGRAIAVDSTGSIYATGYYNNRSNFLTGSFISPSGKDLAYLVRLNALDGTSTFFQAFGSTELDGTTGADGLDIAIDLSNGVNYPIVLMSGKFTGTANFNFTGLSADNNYLNAENGELFVVRMDLNPGNIANSWASNFSEFDSNKSLSLAVDSNGNAFVAHETDIHKISNTGEYQWFKRINFTNFKDIAISSDDVVHTVGTFSSVLANFRAVLNSTPYYCQKGNGNDVFIRKMGADGSFIWARSLVSRVGEDVTSLLIHDDGFYLYGTYADSVDFNLGADTTFLLRTPYCTPSYLAKYSTCANTNDTIPLFACGPIVYEGVTMNNNGQYYVPKNYYAPCDTIETVNFTRGANSVGSITASGCSPYLLNGQPFTTSGTHTQVITNAAGCDSTITLNLTILNTPTTTLTILPNDTICSGQQITAMASGAIAYSWNLNNVTIANNTFNFAAQSNPYDTTVVVTGSTGQCSVSASVQIHINPLPDVSVTGDLNICQGETTTLTASGAETYLWSNNFSESTAVFNPIITTTYQITGTSNGCSTVENFDLVVTDFPDLIITPDTSICQGQTINLEISGATSYQWDNDLGNSSVVNVSPLTTTTYNVIGNTADCLSAAQVTVTYNDQTAPILLVSDDVFICPNYSASIYVSGAENYTWDQGLGNASSYEVSPTTSTIYNVIGESNGCFTHASIYIEVLENPSPVITVSGNELSTGSFVSYQWYFNDELIPTANIQTISGSANGIYTVEVTNTEGCTNFSNPFPFTYISIDERDTGNFLVFPNPTHDEITITSTTPFYKIEMVNVIGEIVSIIPFSDTKNQTLHLPQESGTYLIKIYSTQGLIKKRIVKI